jgi:hypothetical protein
MDKKPDPIYEPGELERVRNKLGVTDEAEAKRMALILGGVVGTEKSANPQPARKSAGRIKRGSELAVPGGRKKNLNQSLGIAEGKKIKGKATEDTADDPMVQLRTPYSERLKMDRYASQYEFEIKTAWHAFVSMITFVGEPADYINPRFINKRMSVYCKKIERLVNATRGLFPRNDARRTERLKKASPFVFSILDTIRHWNIEFISEDFARLHDLPHPVKVAEFISILQAIYKPLFILEKLNVDIHIKGAYKMLFKLIQVENPAESMEKIQELARVAIGAFAEVHRDVRYNLYPLLMKFISDRWFPYEQLFVERHHRLLDFLGVAENDQITPMALNPEHTENEILETVREDIRKEQEEGEVEESPDVADDNTPEAQARKAKEAALAAERRALDHGLGAMEVLFPQAGWDRLQDYPDLYPYFVGIYNMRRGYELISPSDPLQQIAVLLHILEDLCVGLRYVTFSHVTKPDGKRANITEYIGKTITGWRRYIDDSFSKEYLPRLLEYCRLLEHSSDARTTPFAKRTLNELRWIKRLYFLPYYKFESLGPPPFQRQDAFSIYSETKTLHHYLALVAAGIDQGNRNGGAEAKALCDGITNPWDPYNFEVANPVSKRMDMLMGSGKRTNAALIFFALSATTVLDYLLNNESSWVYSERSSVPFRSVEDAGAVPMFGVDNKIDADKIFRDVLKKKEEERSKNH